MSSSPNDPPNRPIEGVLEAPWIGVPTGGWPGFDLEFGTAFWGLLPAFVFVTLIGATETIGDSIAIQQVASRKPRAVDFRAVQGAVAADGAGNVLSGLAESCRVDALADHGYGGRADTGARGHARASDGVSAADGGLRFRHRLLAGNLVSPIRHSAPP